MIDLGTLGFRRFSVLLVVTLCSSAIFYFAFSAGDTRREFISVFLVGKRGLDVPIDNPAHIVEYAQLKLLPGISEAILGASQADVQVVFVNKPGSYFIRIITRADKEDAAKVKQLHERLLQALLVHQQVRLAAIRRHLIGVIKTQNELLSSGDISLKKSKKTEISAVLNSATIQLDNLTPSEVVAPFSVTGIDKVEIRSVRLLLSLLLAFLSVFLLVFLYVLFGARESDSSVVSVK